MLTTVGLEPVSGVARYTFGMYELYEGLDFLVAIIGLFAISEFLLFLEDRDHGARKMPKVDRVWVSFRDIAFAFPAMLRGSGLGFVAGVLPGAGASLGSFLAYMFEKIGRASCRERVCQYV